MSISRLDLLPTEATSIWDEYHTACCWPSDIFFEIKLAEGTDHSAMFGKTKREELGKTVGLLTVADA